MVASSNIRALYTYGTSENVGGEALAKRFWAKRPVKFNDARAIKIILQRFPNNPAGRIQPGVSPGIITSGKLNTQKRGLKNAPCECPLGCGKNQLRCRNKSVFKSAIFSSPTAIRIKFSVMPAACFSSAVKRP